MLAQDDKKAIMVCEPKAQIESKMKTMWLMVFFLTRLLHEKKRKARKLLGWGEEMRGEKWEGGERGEDKRFIKLKQLWTTAKVVSTCSLFFFYTNFTRISHTIQDLSLAEISVEGPFVFIDEFFLRVV